MTVKQERHNVQETIKAGSRDEVIAKFTEWVYNLPLEHEFFLSIMGFIGGVPEEFPDDYEQCIHLPAVE